MTDPPFSAISWSTTRFWSKVIWGGVGGWRGDAFSSALYSREGPRKAWLCDAVKTPECDLLACGVERWPFSSYKVEERIVAGAVVHADTVACSSIERADNFSEIVDHGRGMDRVDLADV